MIPSNILTVYGNLGKDPKVGATKEGRAWATFSVACSRGYKDKSGKWQDATDWVNCVAWGVLAEEIGDHFTKGARVFVMGRMATRSWEDKDGKKHYVSELVAEQAGTLLMTYRKKYGEKGNWGQFGSPDPDDGDVPF